MGFFKRDKDPRPFIDVENVALSLLYFIWRDDLLDSPTANEMMKLMIHDHFSKKESIYADLFCLRYIAGKMGVIASLHDWEHRRDICLYLDALQLSMTKQAVHSDPNDQSLVILRRSFVEHIAQYRSTDIQWGEGVDRTQSYVPAFSVLKARIDEANAIMARAAPDLEKAVQGIVTRFCEWVDASDEPEVELGAHAYFSIWMNMIKGLMPMYRVK